MTDPGPQPAPARPGLTLLVAAGGTGGHVFPGLALARAVVERVPGASARVAGTARGIERAVVPPAGFPIDLLPVLPLSRRLSRETLLAPLAAVAGTAAAWRLLRRHRVDVVAGMGGYVTLPVAVAAWLARIPVVLHEQNAVPGIANRLAARVARTVALGVERTAGAKLPARRTVVTGNPVRPELATLDRQALRERALHELGLEPERRTLLVFGGSQGARHLNQALVEATAHWPDPGALQVVHACGRRDEEQVRAAWREAGPEARGIRLRLLPFVDRMDLAYAAADLAVTRSGAITVAELTAAGVPAVLVPLPHATADHQAANARAVEVAGGAVVVADRELDGGRLAAVTWPLLADPRRLQDMGAAMQRSAHPDATDRLADLVLEAAGLDPSAYPPGGKGRDDTGWFEALRPSAMPPLAQHAHNRSRRMEAYPPLAGRLPPPEAPPDEDGG